MHPAIVDRLPCSCNAVHKFHQLRQALSTKLQTSAVKEPGALPRASIPRRAGRTASHPPDVEGLPVAPWKGEHGLTSAPRAALKSLDKLLSGSRRSRRAAGDRAAGSHNETASPKHGVGPPGTSAVTSRRADLLFQAVVSADPALLIRGVLLTANGGQRLDASTSRPVPLAPDLPGLTMPGAFPADVVSEAPAESPPPPGKRALADRLRSRTAQVADARTRARTAAEDQFAMAVVAGASQAARLFIRGATSAAVQHLPALTVPDRGDLLMPGSFPGTEAAIRASLAPDTSLKGRMARLGAPVLAMPRDAAARFAFHQGVAQGARLAQGGMQALAREIVRQGVSLAPHDRLPGSFPDEPDHPVEAFPAAAQADRPQAHPRDAEPAAAQAAIGGGRPPIDEGLVTEDTPSGDDGLPAYAQSLTELALPPIYEKEPSLAIPGAWID